MTGESKITLSLDSSNISSVIYAKQNDRLARKIVATLYNGSTPWAPPSGAHGVIRYKKPDGTAGFYDTDEKGNSAVSISDNVATLTIAEQALTVPGDVMMELNFYNNATEKITTFSWKMVVQASVLNDSVIVSTDYVNVLTEAIARGIRVAEQLTYPVPIQNGGTGANNAAAARDNLEVVRRVSIIDPSFTGSNLSDLLESLNRINGQLPGFGMFILRLGKSTTDYCRACIFICKGSTSNAAGLVSSHLSNLNGIEVKMNPSTGLWEHQFEQGVFLIDDANNYPGNNSTVQVYKIDTSTLNTPYTEGLTSAAYGVIWSHSGASTSSIQMCIISGTNNIFIRRKYNSVWSAWRRVDTTYSPDDTITFSANSNSSFTCWAGYWLYQNVLYFTIPLSRQWDGMNMSASVEGGLYIYCEGVRSHINLSEVDSTTCWASPSGMIVQIGFGQNIPSFQKQFYPVVVKPDGFTISFIRNS